MVLNSCIYRIKNLIDFELIQQIKSSGNPVFSVNKENFGSDRVVKAIVNRLQTESLPKE